MAKCSNIEVFQKVDVSIIILTKNGGNVFSQCLDGILRQSTSYRYEIICIDSGSTDSSLPLLKKYSIKVVSISEHEFNHGATRNFGFSLAQGRYIILVSQDAIPLNEDWLETLVKTIEADEQIAGVYCRHIPPVEADPFISRRTYKTYPALATPRVNYIEDRWIYTNLSPQQKFRICFFDNVCSCIRKSVWEKVPFSSTNFAEDLEWAIKVLLRGYKTVYQPYALVLHAHCRSVTYEYKRAYLQYRKVYELFELRPQVFFILLLRRLFGSVLGSFYYGLKEKGIIRASASLKRIGALAFVDAFAQHHAYRDHFLKLPYRFNTV